MVGIVHVEPRGEILPDGDGFGPYLLGGGINAKFGTLSYTDAGVATPLFTLPAGAIPILWLVNVKTAFNSSGTNLLDIGSDDGVTQSGAAYANDLDISATGQIPNGYVPAALHTALDVDTDVTATFAQSVADASAGTLTVACLYIIL